MKRVHHRMEMDHTWQHLRGDLLTQAPKKMTNQPLSTCFGLSLILFI